ncbi:uncharacterized protein LOC105694071 [Athalia rosae]|uniref:uncharacterized protein LOC105694071 n=1 Tax=Athalia rosae TaxID=37344 RepID=UPI0020333E6E|nr:uncharacterized protein LOC105694071 [Athalia rosae]
MSRSPFDYPSRSQSPDRNVYLHQDAIVLPEKREQRLRSSSDLNSRELWQEEKPLTETSKNSMSSFTSSVETRFCNSSKSLDYFLEDSLPKLPVSILSSSESERDFGISDCNVTSESNGQEQIQIAANNAGANDFENTVIIGDVHHLMQTLLTKVDVLAESHQISENLEVYLDQKFPKIDEASHASHHLSNEVIPLLTDFNNTHNQQLGSKLHEKCSSQLNKAPPYTTQIGETDDEKKQNCDVVCCELNSDNYSSDKNVEIKYSWQIIPQTKDDELEFRQLENSSLYSKTTSLEDLCANEPEYRYSWQKLTAKYLEENQTGNSLAGPDQSMRNIKDGTEYTNNTEHLNNYVTTPSIVNDTTRRNSTITEHNERSLGNSPLNNIIASMLPDIKRSNFNTSNITSNCDDKSLKFRKEYDSKKSLTYSSVSSIKHVIANLNEMVTAQKNMLDAHVENHVRNSNITHPYITPTVREFATVPTVVEKVEIFPSTLHVLGNYIIRDIRPEDVNKTINLLNANNKEIVESCGHNNHSEIVMKEKTHPTRTAMALSDVEFTKTYDTLPYSPKNSNDTDSSCMLNYPIISESSYYSTSLTPNDFSTTNVMRSPEMDQAISRAFKQNGSSLLSPVLGYDTLREIDWESAIEDMEQIKGLSEESKHKIVEDTNDGTEYISHIQSTEILKHRMQISSVEPNETEDNRVSRENELRRRLSTAIHRLEQCEEHVDADWNLDYSILDIGESISEKDAQLPGEVEVHVKDIVKSAKEYLGKLEEQLKDLEDAKDQIINTSEQTLKNIDSAYLRLMDTLNSEINKRRDLVRLETEVFKYEGLSPLGACKQEVDAQIRSTQHLIVLTETMLRHPVTFNNERFGKIITATSHMGRIPAVPMPEELPYVTFSPPNEDVKREIVDRISHLGCVLRMGPAQFTEVCERPGSLRIKWHLSDPEYACEEQTFIVQKALGEISDPTSPVFETVYIGPETSCFVRDLSVDQSVTLRVGIQVSDTAWSVHRIAKTTIPPYSWDTENADYLITNNGRIATKVTKNMSTLLSQSPQFSADHIIEFKFLEAVPGSNDEGIGLVFEPVGITESLKRKGSILITPNGNIFVDGEQKLMQLPKIQLGTRIVFTSEQKDRDTFRMTIECANKAVTYDWVVAMPLHFAARFSELNKWNFMVK